MYQMYRWWRYIFYCTNIGWITNWSDVFQIIWNQLIWFGFIWINFNWVGIFLISNYRIFAPKFFNLKIISALIIFENIVAYKVFTSNFLWSIPRRDPVGEIQHPSGGVEDVEVDCTVSIWDYSHDGSLWIQSQCGYQYFTRIWEHQYQYLNSRGWISSNHFVPVYLIDWGGRWLVKYWTPSNSLYDSWMGSQYLPKILQTLLFQSAIKPEPVFPYSSSDS